MKISQNLFIGALLFEVLVTATEASSGGKELCVRTKKQDRKCRKEEKQVRKEQPANRASVLFSDIASI